MTRRRRIKRALWALQWLNYWRRKGDASEVSRTEVLLDKIDLEGGYQRHARAVDQRVYQWGEKQGRRKLCGL